MRLKLTFATVDAHMHIAFEVKRPTWSWLCLMPIAAVVFVDYWFFRRKKTRSHSANILILSFVDNNDNTTIRSGENEFSGAFCLCEWVRIRFRQIKLSSFVVVKFSYVEENSLIWPHFSDLEPLYGWEPWRWLVHSGKLSSISISWLENLFSHTFTA